MSPAFELYINIEFKRLKEIEENTYNLEWNVRRIISKSNCLIQTDAIQNILFQNQNFQKVKETSNIL